METYNFFLDYYDKIVRGINSPLDEEVDFLEKLIKEFNPETKDILEFACGTGVIMKEFIKRGYNLYGLDINENMINKAKTILKSDKNLFLGDMRNFSFEKQFDVVLCNYNSICHLLTFEDWKLFFINCYKNLKKGGILIFDINTVYEFENITRDFAQFYNFGEDTVCLEMFKKENYYEWLIKIFKKIKNTENKYELIEEIVKENSFDIKNIKKELKRTGFDILKLEDFHYQEVNEESERVYFICKKS